jgi:hypothetical protein
MIERYVRILLILGMAAVMCGTVSAAGMGIIAETQVTSSVEGYPSCTAPCECISETVAMQRWGADGYDFCSKTVCGQSSDAMVQYYCIHQVGSTAAASTAVPTAKTATSTTAAGTLVTVNVTAQVQTLVQTQTQAPANPVPATTLATPYPIQTKSPVGIATILTAIGAALLVAAGMRRK